ncbi:hypothetical protein J6590_025048 [Homalodisca vitripennis]|nr:hypothetical protein J6590_025048 [Homalodisca vitripennis]
MEGDKRPFNDNRSGALRIQIEFSLNIFTDRATGRLISPEYWKAKAGGIKISLKLARAKKPSLTRNLGSNGLKVTSEPPLTAGQAGCLQGQDRLSGHPSKQLPRCLIWLSCDNPRTRYTAPLTFLDFLPYCVRPHGLLACARILSNRLKGSVNTVRDGTDKNISTGNGFHNKPLGIVKLISVPQIIETERSCGIDCPWPRTKGDPAECVSVVDRSSHRRALVK